VKAEDLGEAGSDLLRAAFALVTDPGAAIAGHPNPANIIGTAAIDSDPRR
jgi:hypothetical protein